jgi:hypothetical protein
MLSSPTGTLKAEDGDQFRMMTFRAGLTAGQNHSSGVRYHPIIESQADAAAIYRLF